MDVRMVRVRLVDPSACGSRWSCVPVGWRPAKEFEGMYYEFGGYIGEDRSGLITVPKQDQKGKGDLVDVPLDDLDVWSLDGEFMKRLGKVLADW